MKEGERDGWTDGRRTDGRKEGGGSSGAKEPLTTTTTTSMTMTASLSPSLPALYVERRRYVEAGNNNGGRRKHFLLPPLSKKKVEILRTKEHATDRPRSESQEEGERERRGDRGSFLHNVSGYWRAGSATPWSLPVCLHGYESRPRPRQTHAGRARRGSGHQLQMRPSSCTSSSPLPVYPLPSQSHPSLALPRSLLWV